METIYRHLPQQIPAACHSIASHLDDPRGELARKNTQRTASCLIIVSPFLACYKRCSRVFLFPRAVCISSFRKMRRTRVAEHNGRVVLLLNWDTVGCDLSRTGWWSKAWKALSLIGCNLSQRGMTLGCLWSWRANNDRCKRTSFVFLMNFLSLPKGLI